MAIKLIIAAVIIFLVYKWFNYKLALTVSSYWMAENKIVQPSSEDINRITNIVMRKWFKRQ